MRFLCLHGRGTNSKVLELQTVALRHGLGDHEFEFVEGSVPWPPAPGIESLLSAEYECYAYFEESRESLCSATQNLEDYITSEGPFDAVMGFSQGASLAATYIVRKTQQDQAEAALKPVFKCAVFICGGDAFDLNGEGAVLTASLVGQVIDVPTAHIVGSKDPYLQASLRLIEICNRESRVVYEHRGDHEVPRDIKTTKEMVCAIKDVIDKAHLKQ